jgi:hypothetical protein
VPRSNVISTSTSPSKLVSEDEEDDCVDVDDASVEYTCTPPTMDGGVASGAVGRGLTGGVVIGYTCSSPKMHCGAQDRGVAGAAGGRGVTGGVNGGEGNIQAPH